MKDLHTFNEIKPKSIIIEGNLHNKFKLLCKGKSMKIGAVIEDLIRLYLDNPKNIQKMIDDFKEKCQIGVNFKVVGKEERIKS
jgi:hypothetical protein